MKRIQFKRKEAEENVARSGQNSEQARESRYITDLLSVETGHRDIQRFWELYSN